MSKTIRISTAIDQHLNVLAKTLGKSKQSIVEKAIEAFIREQFFKKTNEEYIALKKDRKKWKEYLQEQEEWDTTLEDGLEIYE